MRTFSGRAAQVVLQPVFLSGSKQERRGIVIIKPQYSEVWLDRFRETHGDGQGSRLSGQAESRDAGLNTTAPATAH